MDEMAEQQPRQKVAKVETIEKKEEEQMAEVETKIKKVTVEIDQVKAAIIKGYTDKAGVYSQYVANQGKCDFLENQLTSLSNELASLNNELASIHNQKVERLKKKNLLLQERQKQFLTKTRDSTDYASSHMNAEQKSVRFSEIRSYQFQELLNDFGIQVEIKACNSEILEGQEPSFDWTSTDGQGRVQRLGEVQEMDRALQWCKATLLCPNGDDADDHQFDLKNVTRFELPRLRGHSLLAHGTSDLAVGKKYEFDLMSKLSKAPYQYTYALIDLKTDISELNKAQNVLQLMSLARISRFKCKCSLLATDFNKEWELYWFHDECTIFTERYKSGRKCWSAYMALVVNAETRVLPPPKKSVRSSVKNKVKGGEESQNSNEQDLSGFEHIQTPRMKALEDEAYLKKVAIYLSDLYGETPTVPAWAMADNVCPPDDEND